MRTKVVLWIVASGVVLGTTHILAHHAFSAEFDSNKPVKLRGTVTKMEWVNPHAWIRIEVKGPDGKHRDVDDRGCGAKRDASTGLY